MRNGRILFKLSFFFIWYTKPFFFVDIIIISHKTSLVKKKV